MSQPNPPPTPQGVYLRQFDLFRAVTCIGVVAQHSVLWPVTGGSKVGWGLVMVLHFTRNAFFFLSAFVACYAQRTRPRSTGALWYRRLSQVVVPYLVWTAIYFVYTMITSPAPFGSAMHVLWTDIWTGYYQLYFIVVLVQLYVLLPALLWLVRVTRGRHGWVLGVAFVFQMLMEAGSHNVHGRAGTVAGDLHQVASTLLGSRLIVGYAIYVVAGLLAAEHVDEIQRLVARHWSRLLAVGLAGVLVASGYYTYGLFAGETPGRASGLYQPVPVVCFLAIIVGLYALGWRWAERVARQPGSFLDRLVTWGSDMSGGFYLSHVLVLQLVLTGLGDAGLRAATSWGVVSIVLFVATVAGTAILVSIVLRTPLRWILTGPDRTRQRATLDWFPPPAGPEQRDVGLPSPVAAG